MRAPTPPTALPALRAPTDDSGVIPLLTGGIEYRQVQPIPWNCETFTTSVLYLVYRPANAS
ncbi:hypothetical protein [Nonomuraea sp. NPDC050786]|uniref:hypothetical protein n=1 Tax=Nonomuraea sp. NPDC050786 TaxID=3154840 RepID=UPI00340661BC